MNLGINFSLKPSRYSYSRVSYNTYATLAQGEAAEVAGAYFLVMQSTGNGAYLYERTLTGSIYKGVQLAGPNASVYSAARSAVSSITSAVAGMKVHLWGTNAWEWDGRVVPNEATNVLPTLNLLPDPFNPKNESGGATPALEMNTTSTLDPLGGTNAEKLTITAQNQQLRVYTTGVSIPVNNYRLRMQVKSISGGTGFRLGTTSGATVTTTGSWVQHETALTSFSGVAAVGISSATGNSSAEIAVANAQMLDQFAGESLPTLEQELASQNAGHLKMPMAFVGSSPIDANGSIVINGTTGGHVIHTNVNNPTVSSYTLGVWLETAMPSGSYGSAVSFDYHSIAGGATNLYGQIGIYGAAASVAGRPGRLYVNPNLSTSVSAISQHFENQGKHHITVTVSNGSVMAYVNTVPIWLGSLAGWSAPKVARLLLGAYNNTSPRRKTLNALPAGSKVQGVYYYEGTALTQEQVIQMDAHGRERLRLTGDSPGLRKMLNIGCGDSLTAFGESYWWHLGENTQLSPRLHGHLEAVGGTRLADFMESPRYTRLCQRIDAGVASGYDEVWLYVLAGANDAPYWNDTTDIPNKKYSFADWKPAFLTYIAGLKARSPKVKVAILTMIPLPTGGLTTEVYRNTWNNDVRTNWASMGFDAMIDTGLGTEKVDGFGVVTAEPIPNGTLMGNWRASQGAITHTRSPGTSLTLSALSASSFTATATAGTFSSADVYRRITGGTGSARITAVDATGSIATLTTATFAPTAWVGEAAATLTRDTVTYSAFDSLSFVSGAWAVRNDASFYQLDGIHPTYAGGRILSDNKVAPMTQVILDGLTGLAL